MAEGTAALMEEVQKLRAELAACQEQLQQEQKGIKRKIQSDSESESQESVHADVQDVLFSEQQIDECVRRLGAQINKDYANCAEPPLVVGVLTGACIFHADLLRSISIPVELDFVSLSSYGNGSETSGTVTFRHSMNNDAEDHPNPNLRKSVKGRDIILVEDIVDTGTSLVAVCEHLATRGAKSIRIAALLDKVERRHPEKAAKLEKSFTYRGFMCPNEFVIGYGIDYAEKYRNLPYVASLKRAIYEKK